eukprot:TRINITY_DN104515_c0_g1_i1.p1 TRINITY_DN104515_c0_g1~~TRINITY_DN104515_c0_g1_i1.p1  ORF type:complete len:373 (-),score=53.81 TRINITY_DN104515_c0_g1_i1:315-1373(-)
MADIQEPEVCPFTYLYIPCDGGEIIEHKFTGNSDSELRQTLSKHFQKNKLTTGQSQEVAQSMKVDNAALAAEISDKVGFEIVPIIYPKATTGFVGTSLYIDEVGRFKELPLNDRASKIAQREIKGDAFLLQCLDNEMEDVWRRVDCTKSRFEELYASPPSQAPDPQTQMKLQQLMSAKGKMVEPDAIDGHEITNLEVEKAQAKKTEGATLIKAGNYEAAAECYTEAIKAIAGAKHAECSADEETLMELKRSCYSNRALCNTKLEKWGNVATDSTWVINLADDETDKLCTKALYRRGVARMHKGEFDEAGADLQKAKELDPNDSAIAKAKSELPALAAKFRRKEEGVYKAMFA